MIRRTRGGAVAVAIATAVGLAACSGTSPAAVPSSSPTATAGAAGTPAPTAASPGDQAVARFLARLASPGFSYHVAITGDQLATITDLSVTGTIDVGGRNVATSTTYAWPDGRKSTVATRFVGGRTYVRVDKGSWRSTTTRSSLAVDPFAGAATPGYIKYGGTRVVGDRTLDVLVITGGKLLDPTTIPAYNLTDEKATFATLTVFVDSTGAPVTASWDFRGQGRVSGQLQELHIVLKATFSKVGSKISVSAP